MKAQIIFLCVLGVIASVLCAPQQRPQAFGDTSEITPIEEEYVRKGLDCIFGRAECTEPELKAKKLLPIYLRTGTCDQCDQEMMKKIGRVFYVIHQKFPSELRMIRERFGQGSAH